MKPNEIRGLAFDTYEDSVVELLQEIAAQLAELNATLKEKPYDPFVFGNKA